MPERNEVPSLKMLSTRKVAWPDGINRTDTDVYPCAEQYCRDTIYRPFLNNNLAKLRKLLGVERLKELSSNVTNYWIRLSNHYHSPFTDFKHIEPFLKLHPPQILDFIHEGFTFQYQSDKAKIIPFLGLVPSTSAAQSIGEFTWRHIVASLRRNDVIPEIKELHVKFGNEHDHKRFEIPQEFEDYFEHFHNLTKLIIRGVTTDNILMSVGLNCYRLKYLDISKSEVTEVGIRMLFYKGDEAERNFETAFTTSFNWNLPKHFLRPLTKSLEYFDMSDVIINLKSDYKYGTAITMACPEMVVTPNMFFFRPSGKIKIRCKEFHTSPTFVTLRQQLVLHLRSSFCQDIFCFVRGFLACTHTDHPAVEVRVDEIGQETSFLIYSRDFVIAYWELENLTVINFTSYTKSTCAFIPLELLSHLAPNLQKLKASLKGVLSNKYPLKSLKHVTAAMIYSLDTFESLVKRCPELHYLEIRELLLCPTYMNDTHIKNIFEDGACKLEVLRLIFLNNISLLYGLTYVITKCPSLRILGDLKYWSMSEQSFTKLHQQFGFHNFRIAIEYDNVIYYSNTVCEEIPR